MREIKFRAWDKENNYMFQVHALSLPINLMVHTELMQFTGLKDKNSVEIYEGDILRIYDDFNTKVFYSLRFSSFEVATSGNSVGFYSKSELEVIGNIYENPELLENK